MPWLIGAAKIPETHIMEDQKSKKTLKILNSDLKLKSKLN